MTSIDMNKENGHEDRDEVARDRLKRNENKMNRDGKERDRSPRDRKRSGPGDRERSPRERSSKRHAGDRRVYLSNIAYEYRWQELKDLFRKEVGEVSYVELFMDENDKPRGCGIVEFETSELAKKAVQKMHRYDLKGRKLVVKEDFDCERDKFGRPVGGTRPDTRNTKQGGRDDRQNWGNNSGAGVPDVSQASGQWGNTYGLSVQFLESLGIKGPLITRLFVANLDYKVDQKKLKEVFKLAGRVVRCELSLDKDGKSRGFGIIEYEHPVEAVQAISMLNNQVLFDRRLTVRFDREGKSDGPLKLPEGLKGLGIGLGSNGQPLYDVPRNLPSSINSLGGGSVNITAAVQNPLAAAAALGSSVSALGVGASNLGLGLGNSAVAGLGGSGVDRFLDNAPRRMDVVGSLGGGGGPSLGGGVLPPSGGGDLGLGGAFGGGSGNAPFGSGQLGPQSNYIGGGGAGRDFDTLSAAISGGYNAQVGDREFRRGGAGQGGGGGGPMIGNNNNMSTASGGKGQMVDSIIVKNLPNVSWQQLKDKFSEAGDVKFAEVNNTKDMGLVQFGSPWEAHRAISLFDRSRWDGQALDVRFY